MFLFSFTSCDVSWLHHMRQKEPGDISHCLSLIWSLSGKQQDWEQDMLDPTLQFSHAHILDFQGSCVKISRRGKWLSHRDSRGFCFIYRAPKPRILNTAEEQVWAQEDRFWDMLLSVTPGKDAVKTQLSFQSKHYQHHQIQPQRETIRQPTFQKRILTLSLSGTHSARLGFRFKPKPQH